ncbi:Kinesin-related motor protein [Komagataella phaffii CBS 7435]|uniref:Kinesin-like protein n=2 Tax=Komagataella phaffii TaxID=460519 RepID=C4R6U3_KOMPG|nr:Kinesin-related motor protein involved in mitotic spindle positioning [Komagataella phaffii GS115]AOA64830.1 GQ67_04400T0 [Komagataella phaffii]CAH2451338.1 Kinesin-related motor protein [Komagataella phaffii CBS 7435]AOA70211.1 GQ68_04372T0 [Komagataella phaffii GS115]CAY71318.1 Kinesin-related motor protein involved in mitotic spindle positioning [Komagataella phaffii GS115]CCA41076.1 Kinesin-related motor protein [Komagataella phaffii CBS 7435]
MARLADWSRDTPSRMNGRVARPQGHLRPPSSASSSSSQMSTSSYDSTKPRAQSALSGRTPTRRPMTPLSNKLQPGLATPMRPASSLRKRPSTPTLNSYKGKINVSVRPRPLLSVSHGNTNNPWFIENDNNTIAHDEAGEFQYDNVFDPLVNNRQVYDQVVKPVVEKAMDGFNGTIFAYGMTGSGKTYSMQGSEFEDGLIQLAVNQIFDTVRSDPSSQYTISCSFLEIYNERIFDLLNPESANALRNFNFGSIGTSSKDELKIRDDPIFGTKVIGLHEEIVTTPDDLIHLIHRGDQIRKTGGTDYNSRSSRSHAIVSIKIKKLTNSQEFFATLSLCDLAGSEKATTQIERRKEGSFINKSLLALGTVISKLSQNQGSLHIPYRDSKLTRFLQPSLSGESVVSILCTIHLSQITVGETLNTLRFASRAKNIAIAAARNGSNVQDNFRLESLAKELVETKRQLMELQLSSTKISDTDDEQLQRLRAENRILSEQVEHFRRMSDLGRADRVNLSNDIVSLLGELRESDSNRDTVIQKIESFNKHQQLDLEEMKSYISHLEHMMKTGEKFQVNPQINASSKKQKTYEELFVGSEGLSLKSLVKDQEEEIMELKEMLKEKDSIIKALRTAKRARDSVLNIGSNNTSDLENEYEDYTSAKDNLQYGKAIKTVTERVQLRSIENEI